VKRIAAILLLTFLLTGIGQAGSDGEGMVDTLAYDSGLLSGVWSTGNTFFGLKFTPCYPCTLLSAWIFLSRSRPCTLLMYDWPPGIGTLRDSQPFTSTQTNWSRIDLDRPYFYADTFFVGFNLTQDPPDIACDFGPGNYRGFRSSNHGQTWSPTGLGNNAMIRAVVRYNVPTQDAAVASIDYPGHILPPDSVITPVATVRNSGLNPIDFDVTCTVDSCDFPVYSSTQSVSGLAPDSTTEVEFDDWNPVGAGYPCVLTVVTQLATDSLGANDTLTLTTTPFSPITSIPSGWATVPPTLDGAIDILTEWRDAFCLDVSDLCGRFADPEPARTVMLYVMNDSTALYLALDYNTIHHEESNSSISFYFDDNNDGTWATDSGEGYCLMKVSNSYNDRYCARPSRWTVYNPSGIEDAYVNRTRYFTYESRFGLDDATRWLLQAEPGDTIGFHCCMYSTDSRRNPTTIPIWWPTMMDSAHHETPEHYGNLVLSDYSVGVAEPGPGPARTILHAAAPNPFQVSTRLAYTLSRPGRLSLGIYDRTGQLIRTLVDGIMPAGTRTAQWDGNSNTGRKVSAGVYFATLRAGDHISTGKLMLLR
jgi:hypothetical protein